MSEIPPSAEPPARSRTPKWVWWVVPAGAILVAALVFVTVAFLLPKSSPDPQPNRPGPTPSAPQPTTEPEPPAAAPIVIPECPQLNPEAWASAEETTARYSSVEMRYGDIGTADFSTGFGPAAQAALSQSINARGCTYPFGMETGLRVYTAELSGAPRDAFLAQLRADGDFVESTSGAAQVFVWEQTDIGGHWGVSYTLHAFIGDVWIATYGPYPPEMFTPSTIAAILAANPTLG